MHFQELNYNYQQLLCRFCCNMTGLYSKTSLLKCNRTTNVLAEYSFAKSNKYLFPQANEVPIFHRELVQFVQALQRGTKSTTICQKIVLLNVSKVKDGLSISTFKPTGTTRPRVLRTIFLFFRLGRLRTQYTEWEWTACSLWK